MADTRAVLVTGGAGFIGQAVCAALTGRGYTVTALDIDNITHKCFFDDPVVLPQVKKVRGSILDAPFIDSMMRGQDMVIHLAAALGVHYTDNRPRECLNTNIMGTVNILEACVKERVKKIVFSSSSEVYGEPERVPIVEDDRKNPMSVYAVTKLAAEEYLRAYNSYYKLDYGIIRFFNVYGLHQVAQFVLPKFVRAVQAGEAPVVYGDGSQVRAYCYVDDAAVGVVKVLESTAAEKVFNIGNDTEPVSVLELARRVAQVLGRPELAPRIVPFSESDRKPGREIYNRLPSLERAKQILGYAPTVSLDEGIRRVAASDISADWHRQV